VSLNTAVMFAKATDEWRTPEALFTALDAEFGFDADVAATADNCWKENYIGPDRGRPDRLDALNISWRFTFGLRSTVWMNPPYSKCREFIAKAAAEARLSVTTVALVPSRTDTRWWHEHVWDAEKHQPRPGVEIRFIKGRLKFGGSSNSAPFPSVVIVFRPVPA
jgi:phage N-6-adenine-methyltransferase